MKAREFSAEMKKAGAVRMHCRTCRFIGEEFPPFGNMVVCVEFKHATLFFPLKLSMFTGKY